MITEIVYDVLKSNKYTVEQKIQFLENSGLTYSEFIMLEKQFSGNNLLHSILHRFVAYNDVSFAEQVKKQNRQLSYARRIKRKKSHKGGKKRYDKY